MIKYSIGGQITTVVDNNSVQEKEVNDVVSNIDKIYTCGNCGIQWSVKEDALKICECGKPISIN